MEYQDFEFLLALEGQVNQAGDLVSMALVIETALEKGDHEAEAYLGAQTLLVSILSDHAKELKEIYKKGLALRAWAKRQQKQGVEENGT